MHHPLWPKLRSLTAVLLCLAAPIGAAAQGSATPAQPLRIGVVLDGASPTVDAARAAFEREVTDFFEGGAAVSFPANWRLTGDWTLAGANAALDRLLAAPDVDLVLALGPIGSEALARRATLAKPAIAALVVDAAAQRLPRAGAASGIRNLTYADLSLPVGRTLEVYHEVVPYQRLALLAHPGLIAALPAVADSVRAAARRLGAELDLVPVTGSADAALAAIPAGADAVYLGPLDQLPPAGMDSLVRGLTTRRLPTFSVMGRSAVDRGVLLTWAAPDDAGRRARRVASLIRRLQDGEEAASLPVALVSVPRLTFNLATARAIGFSPTWQVLIEAELLHEEVPAGGPRWSLAAVGHEASRVNLDLLAARQAVASSEQEARQARAALLPQLSVDATGTLTRSATAEASLGQRAEREAQLALGFSQAVLDDRARTGYRVARDATEGRVADRRRRELDAVLDATTAYLAVLRTRALARVERENAALTRSNLEVAQLRERTGAGGPADVYRWQAELAQARRKVLDANAQVELAALQLNATLNHPLEEAFQVTEADVIDPALLVSEPRLLDYLSTPARFAAFRDFTVREGLAAAPELQALDARIQAESRQQGAATRSFFLPTVTLEGGASSIVGRGGAGSDAPALGGLPVSRAPDETWSLRLKASLPLFTGFGRTARAAEARSEVARLRLEREATAVRVGLQVRSALQLAGASWASIAQAREAAVAARKHLDVVTDAYGRGTVSILALLDAQQASLSANEAAAGAVYTFLSDLMKAQRAAGAFDFFRSPEESAGYFARLDAFYQAAGLPPVRP